MEKPKNVYVRPMDMNLRWGNDGGRRVEGNKGQEKKWDNYNSIINKIYLKHKTNKNDPEIVKRCLFKHGVISKK